MWTKRAVVGRPRSLATSPNFVYRAITLSGVGLLGIAMLAKPEIIGLVLVLGAIVVWGLLAALIGRAAEAKGRDRLTFFLFAFFFSPLLMGLIVACMAKPSAAKATE